jgi:pilus assembly protein Flp/PilA
VLPFLALIIGGGGIVQPGSAVERNKMPKVWTRLRAEIVLLHTEESAQDLVEYALVAVVIALAATAGMSSVAKEINDVFSNVTKKITLHAN